MHQAPRSSTGTDVLQQRCKALVALFENIRDKRMQGVPILNRQLGVTAIGFERTSPVSPQVEAPAAQEPPGAAGILITPWFMNLVWFALQRQDLPARVGSTITLTIGGSSFGFIVGHEAQFGAYAACSLFSPMFEFADQAAAEATAAAVLGELRQLPPPPIPAARVARPASGTAADRRSFLFGRSSPHARSAP